MYGEPESLPGESKADRKIRFFHTIIDPIHPRSIMRAHAAGFSRVDSRFRLATVRTEKTLVQEFDHELNLAMGLLEGEEWARRTVDEMMSPEIALNKPPKVAGVRVSFHWRNPAAKKLPAGRPLLSLDGVPLHSHPELQLAVEKHLPDVNEGKREPPRKKASQSKSFVMRDPRRTRSTESSASQQGAIGRTRSTESVQSQSPDKTGGSQKAGQGQLPAISTGTEGSSPDRKPSNTKAPASISSPPRRIAKTRTKTARTTQQMVDECTQVRSPPTIHLKPDHNPRASRGSASLETSAEIVR